MLVTMCELATTTLIVVHAVYQRPMRCQNVVFNVTVLLRVTLDIQVQHRRKTATSVEVLSCLCCFNMLVI